MPIYNQLPPHIEEVDIIVAGGGASGCVIASRVAAAAPHLEILLIESGENNHEERTVIHPGLRPTHFVPGSKTITLHIGNPQAELAGRSPVVSVGHILAGGSSINACMYSRALARDFLTWNTPGWTSEDLMPLMRRVETYHGPGKQEIHGHDGPVHVSNGGYINLKTQSDIIAAAELCGYKELEDLQDTRAGNGVERGMKWVDLNGKRQDAAHTYLHPLINKGRCPNLHVLCQTKVSKVLFDGSRKAVGVEAVQNPLFRDADDATVSSVQTIRARKLVVLSCGTCVTPGILERSGVGDPAVLARAGINMLSDLPGVGNDFQDHHIVFVPYKTNLKPGETMDVLEDARAETDGVTAELQPLLKWNGVDVCGKIRPTNSEVKALGSAFENIWNNDFASEPEKPLMLIGFFNSYVGSPDAREIGQHVSALGYTPFTYSRGDIHVKSGDVNDPPRFNVGYCTDKDDIDLKMQLWAYKTTREIMRRTNLYTGEVEKSHPKFPENSAAVCVNLDVNGTSRTKDHIKNIEYSSEDDKAIEEFLRKTINTAWHGIATCKMAPRERKGVVDTDLNVYGVTRLKCCDLSIVPENIAANTYGTALVIGEKGADIVLKELGLGSVNNSIYHEAAK